MDHLFSLLPHQEITVIQNCKFNKSIQCSSFHTKCSTNILWIYTWKSIFTVSFKVLVLLQCTDKNTKKACAISLIYICKSRNGNFSCSKTISFQRICHKRKLPSCQHDHKERIFNSLITQSPSYKNQFNDLLWKSIDWFLCDRDLRHARVNSLEYIYHWKLADNSTELSFLITSWDNKNKNSFSSIQNKNSISDYMAFLKRFTSIYNWVPF